MFQENHFATVAPHEFARQHHTKACLYFAISALETALNQFMRKKMAADGKTEEQIYSRLRSTNLEEKARRWPQEVSTTEIAFDDEFFKLLGIAKDLRNEATHPKQVDHTNFTRINQFHTQVFINHIIEAIVHLYTSTNQQFPYYLLGWNYVGINKDPAQPLEINNHQFLKSLRNLGFDVPTIDYGKEKAWLTKHMTSIDSYNTLKKMLSMVRDFIEPKIVFHPDFAKLTSPRLCKRWWDRREIIGHSSPEVPRWIKGWGVYKPSPWHFIGLYNTSAEAEDQARNYGEGYVFSYGEHVPGTDDFIMSNF